jgi:hypothetical protein
VAGLEDGGFVVTWGSFNQDGNNWGIYGQRYGANGAAVGGEFQVNTFTPSTQIQPSVTGLDDGGFVVDGSGYGIYGQRFAANGSAMGSEFQLNQITAGDQYMETTSSSESIAALADGRLVATWNNGFGSGEVYVRLFDVPYVDQFDVTVPVDTDADANAVAENAAAGTVAGLAAFAVDADSSNNAVTYTLTGNPGGLFAIDPTTGIVTLAAAIDRETVGPSVDIEVTATSQDGSAATQTFTIAIGDVDEHDVSAPIDTDGAANAVAENASIGTVVGLTAFASDADATSNGVTYTLTGNPGGLFVIDPATGIVTLAAPRSTSR